MCGEDLYTHRNSTNPAVRAYYEHYSFGLAFAIMDRTRYISTGVLGIHIVLAIGHMLVLLWTRRSSRSWDSMEELVILAYNPATRPGAFKNCSSGVANPKTLDKKARVGTRVLDDGSVQAELMCGSRGTTGNIVAGKSYS
jgi:hypothetical protein